MNIRESGFFVIRTPLLPLDEASKWSESIVCADLFRQGADAEAIKRAWIDDLELLRVRLLAILQRPASQQALAVASPSLCRAIPAWVDSPNSKKGLQAERALTRYFMRMTGRSTPFGLFAGCSLGTTKADAPTQIVLAPQAQYCTATRLDIEYITSLTTALRKDPDARDQMHYKANSSLHRTAHGWHYIECRSSGKTHTYHLAKLESDVYLDSVIANAKDRHLALNELAAVLASADSVARPTDDEITEYLNTLIANQILVPHILPRITGDGALEGLLDDLLDIPAVRNVYTVLGNVKSTLFELDRRPLTVEAHEYSDLAEQLKGLPGTVDPERTVHVDMFKPVETANLGHAVISEMLNALRVLGSFAVVRDLPTMTAFRDGFVERYEKQWVPLAEALDPELGVGYGDAYLSDDSPLLSGLALASGSPKENRVHLDPFQSFLLQKIIDSAAAESSEIEIRDDELLDSSAIEESLPESFSVVVSLVSKSIDALSKDDFDLLLHGGQGPSSARALARFCSSDFALKDLVRDALRQEEASNPEAIFAEIVYQPEGRSGNLVCRPLLREYEIPFMGRSGGPIERQLTLDDLLVGVADGRVTLYSRSLQRRIQPRLSSAHNYSISGVPSVYRFLCDLQNQGGLNVPSFKWGPLSKLKRLPRVRTGRVVLARAQWRISYTEVEGASAPDRFEEFLKFKKLQRDRKLPRWVMVSEYDSTLPLDLDNPLCVDSLLQLLKRSREIVLLEMYPDRCNKAVVGPEGAFQHELIIPLHKVRQSTTTSVTSIEDVRTITTAAGLSRIERYIPPGGSWHYVKIYSGYSFLDELLTEDIGPLMTSLCEAGFATDWFFVRYADPQPHVRLRFRSKEPKALESITEATKTLLASGRALKIQWDTYQREIERYGGSEGILISEELFCADSDSTLKILRSLDSEDPDMRWKSAMLGMERFLTDCRISMLDRAQLADRMRSSLAKELRVTSHDKHEIGIRFRTQRAALGSFLDNDTHSMNSRYTKVNEAYVHRSHRIRSAVDRLKELEDDGRLLTPLINVVASHLHMNLNRMMRSDSRIHEFVLYEFLYRVYEGRCARERAPM